MPFVSFVPRLPGMLLMPRMRRTATLLGALALFGAIQPASATTLYRCKLNGRIVYSDTDCPAHASKWASSFPASKPIHISTKRKIRKPSK
jgi:hypothetical protein